MSDPRPTRGHGLMEGWLARQRAARADALIPPAARSGAILDVGCGSFPYFLSQTRFARRAGVDRHVAGAAVEGIELRDFDIDHADRLPFEDASFDVVTMLAVFEHIKKPRLSLLLGEVDRVLKPGGVFVMTTPSDLAEPVLKVMKWLRLVSAQEVEEHEDHYSPSMIRDVLSRTPIRGYALRMGRFELGLNVWAAAKKAEASEPEASGFAPR